MSDPFTAAVAVAATASGVVESADKSLSVIRRLYGQLRAQPDLAAVKLSAVLDEVGKTYQIVDSAITRFGSLAVDEGALTSRSTDLFAIAGGSLEHQVEAGRGHSQTIRDIYEQHLFRWFEKVFNLADMTAMDEAFNGPTGLGQADSGLFVRLAEMAQVLTAAAAEALKLVQGGDIDRARAAIVTCYQRQLAPLQQQMSASMLEMARLKNDFVELAREAK